MISSGKGESMQFGVSIPMTVSGDHVKFGSPPHVDQGVVVGYMPERKGVRLDLRVGKAARLRSGTCIYAGTVIGDNFQTGHNVLIREECEIGDDVSVWSNTVIDYGCRIGNRVKIHCNVYIPQFTLMEDDVFVSPGCTFANDVHPGCESFRECMRGPVLKQGVVVGVNVTIVPKVTIGEYSLIGSGSVVTKDIPPYSVVAGNPARVLRKTKELKCKSGLRDSPYAHP
jgi:acetyltransferase-like isoleucine patch superfamily enzyme